MAKRINNDEFLVRLKNKWGNEYIPKETYVNSRTKIKVRHNNCGNIWSVSPSNLLQGYGCPLCNGTKLKTTEEFKLEVNKIDAEYQVISEYKNGDTKIKFKHNKCGHEFLMTPHNFLNGQRCPECFRQSRFKTPEQFKKEFYQCSNNEYELVHDYINSQTKITVKHKNCNNEYEVIPYDFLRGHRCPFCSRELSLGEEAIEKYLNKNNIKYIKEHTFNSCRNINILYFDFYLPDLGIIIEFDGGYHFKDAYNLDHKIQVKRDIVKNNWCKYNNINMLRICYKDLKNIDLILENFLNSNFDFPNYNVYFQVNGFELNYGDYLNHW